MSTLTDAINLMIKDQGVDANKVSDGYHTFGELYEHRIVLYIALCRMLSEYASSDGFIPCIWKSIVHSDGSSSSGWFVLGIGKDHGKQITYHLPIKFWDNCDFAMELGKAPEFDGHTSNDVLERLKTLV